ncbi:MAG: sulfatase-like hydrolase/transferase [Proteobacteria bacterium]|nr:sulfatase-like hydrolase/transferase [Pseudomonadota bacterium]
MGPAYLPERLSRRDLIKRSMRAGLVVGGIAAFGTAGYTLFRNPSIDKIYGQYPDQPLLQPLTGRYPVRTGIIGNPYPADSRFMRRLERNTAYIFTPLGSVDLHEEYVAAGLSNKEITIAEALKIAGYRTAMIGKWHQGCTTSPLIQARTTTLSIRIPMSPKRCTAYSLSGNSRLKGIRADLSFDSAAQTR